MNPIRLNRYLASAGIASRRNAEELILAGRVAVNGEVATLTTPVMSEDKVTLDGSPVEPEAEKVYFLLNKPKGYVCSTKGEERVVDLFEEIPYRLFTVGRLDKETEGLILVTNDGEFADNVIHPSKNLEKEYVAKADLEIEDTHLKLISQGTLVEGVMVAPLKVEKIRRGTLKIVIGEGKKREVRHLLEAAGLKTVALRRIRLGSLVLGDLEVGAFRPLKEEEIARLLAGSNESEEIPESSLVFQEQDDQPHHQEKAPREGFDTRAPRLQEERRPFQQRSFSPRDGGERGFAGRGRPQGDRPPFQREERSSSRFGSDRKPPSSFGREGSFERRERSPEGSSPQGEGRFPRSFSPKPREFSDRAPRPSFASRQTRSDFSERAPRGDRREGGFSDRPRSNDRREGGFGDRRPREGGFGSRPPREGGFGSRPPREGGFGSRPPREGGFGDRRPREGGFGSRPPREGGFVARPREGGFGSRPPREGGFSDRPRYNDRREGGFGSRPPREGGFSARPSEGRFSDRPRFDRAEGGRAPRESRGESRFPSNRDRAPSERGSFPPREDA